MDSDNTSHDTETAAPVGSTTANGIQAESGDSTAARDPHRAADFDDLLARWDHQYRAGQEPAMESLCPIDSSLFEPLRDQIDKLKKLYAFWGLPPTEAAGSEQAGEPAPEFPGHEVIGEIGRGGMGVVYKARDQKLGRFVAIKTIPQGRYATADQRNRFLAEASAIARLHHPNIIAIHAVGEHENRPYLSLEFADGGSLAQRLAEKPMAAREAAGLVETLARAVHAAHLAGIVHRDLKPSNVLLTAEGVPKVSDFGLAKLLDEDSARTLSGQPLGTPSYMAPEQAEGRSKHAGPSADIYALGAILYHALAGRPPFLGESALETLKLVTSTEAVPPRRLRPDVPRDAETICLRCLEKEPRKRYATSLAVADDLRRFLDDRPINARPAGSFERSWRWCRRNPRVAILSVAVVSSLAAGTIVSSVLALRATRAERTATQSEAATRQQWVRAESEAAKAKQSEAQSRRSESEALAMLGFFQNKVLAAARPKDQEGGLGINATIRDALDAAEPSIEKTFAGQPVVEASIRATLGESYRILGEPALAIRQMERSRELRGEIADHADPGALDNLNNLASAYIDAGRLSDAISLYLWLLGRIETEFGPDHSLTLQCRNNLGIAYENAGRLPEAIALHEATLKLQEAKLEPEHPDTLISRANLAVAYENVGRLPEAIALHKTTLKMHEAKLGRDHPDTLLSRTSLASALASSGRMLEVIELLEETLRMQEPKIGPHHNHTLVTRTILANAYLAVGRTLEAIELHKTTLEIRESTLGADHPFTLMSRNNLAVAYLDAGRCHEAIPLHEAAVKAREAALGPSHPHSLLSRNNLARAYESIGRLADSERLRHETLTRRRKTDKPDSPHLAGDLAGLGSNMIAQSRWVEAEALLRECLAIREKAMPRDWKQYEAMCLLGAALLNQRRYAEAEKLLVPGYEGARDRQASIPFRDRSTLLAAGERIIRLYEEWEKPEEAAAWKAKLGMPDLPGDVFAPR
jgi:serine/threonine protein kinase